MAAQPYPGNFNYTPSLFRCIPQMDIQGTLAGNEHWPGQPLLSAHSESACQLACLNAPVCAGYSYLPLAAQAPTMQSFVISDDGNLTIIIGECYIYSSIKQLIPNSVVYSGVPAAS